jgi:hypothetical protein
MAEKEKISDGVIFLRLFQELKRYCSDKPSRFRVCYQDSSKFQEIVRELECLERRIDSSQANSSRKEILHVHDDFPAAWEDYKKRWKAEVLANNIRDNMSLLREISSDDYWEMISKMEEMVEKQPKENLFSDPDYDSEDKFDPLTHSPAQVFLNGLCKLENDLIGMADMWDESDVNRISMALEGWNYIEQTIGIDIDGISRRWKKTPYFQIPKRVSDKHGNGTGSFYDLLYAGYKAYVFGLFAPSIVMCRAVCEEVLKKHYSFDWNNDDGKQKPLMTVVKGMRDEEKNFQKKKFWDDLIGMVKQANAVVHIDEKKSHEHDEEITLKFLNMVKGLIESAPYIKSAERPNLGK